MLFSSVSFIYLFLPAVMLLYFASPRRIKNAVLLFSSLAFYFMGEPVYILLLLFSSVSDFVHGLIIDKLRGRRGAKIALVSAIVINLLMLGFFKYANFFISLVNSALGTQIPLLNIPLPIGISFFTFQTMSYSIDVFRGDAAPSKNLLNFGAYVTLFPQLIAGPIVRYKDVEYQLTKRKETLSKFSSGVVLFLCGLAKKVLLANRFAAMWQNLGAANAEGILARWGGLLALTLWIYFDFSGYSDMARGLGRMFGFEFMENFNYPYISKSITEFWRRWHISLSTWFRDYLYIPLGGNRKGFGRQIFNLFIVWAATGMWHGAEYNFLIWGLYFFVLLVLEKLFLSKVLAKVPSSVSHIYALFFIMIGWAIFNFTDINALWQFICGLFSAYDGVFSETSGYVLLTYLPTTLVGIVLSTPVLKLAHRKLYNKKFYPVVLFAGCAVVMLLCTATLVSDSYNPFIYFRF